MQVEITMSHSSQLHKYSGHNYALFRTCGVNVDCLKFSKRMELSENFYGGHSHTIEAVVGSIAKYNDPSF